MNSLWTDPRDTDQAVEPAPVRQPERADSPSMNVVTRLGIASAIAALLVPLLALLALAFAAITMIRGEIGAGFGIALLAFVCVIFGLGSGLALT